MAEDKKNSKSSAAAYASLRSKLNPFTSSIKDIKVNPEISKKIADAYSAMQHNPDDPKVQKAYKALIDETVGQYEDMQKAGMKISKITSDMHNPYKSSKDVVDDVAKNKHLWYYPTEQGFGSADTGSSNHPMLQPTKILDADGKPMPANDIFRAVHDYEGHAKEGHKFGATGEERAFQEHSKKFSPEAKKALLTETRGQNSWVNYGPHGEANRANPSSTIYADQKAGLMPDWAGKNIDELASPTKYAAKKAAAMAIRAGLPALALGAASGENSIDEALMNTVIPGGTEAIGESPDEEAILRGESQGYKDYQTSPAAEARRAALDKLRR